MIYEISLTSPSGETTTHKVEIDKDGSCRIDGAAVAYDATVQERDVLSLIIGGKAYEVRRDGSNGSFQLWVNGVAVEAEVRDPRSLRGRKDRSGGAEGAKKITAPMPGKVVRILAPAGTEVESGQGVIVIEAMKMQNELKSPKAGKVTKVAAKEGAAVNAGDVLAIVE